MTLPLRLLRACILLGLSAFFSALTRAQNNDLFTFTTERLRDGKAVELDKLKWKYQPGDDLAWADPRIADRACVTLTDSAKPESSQSSWLGIGWFRLHLRGAPELSNGPLNLEMAHRGRGRLSLATTDHRVLGRARRNVGRGARTRR